MSLCTVVSVGFYFIIVNPSFIRNPGKTTSFMLFHWTDGISLVHFSQTR